jgi:predicted nucleic acid-binding protein
MASEPAYLVDTNILLRLPKQDDPNHPIVEKAMEALVKRGARLCYTSQNISEFWNVCTRPTRHNGFGLTVRETNARVEAIERVMTLLPDNEELYRVWRQLVVLNNVKGVQVHDARLAAAVRIHGISHVLTFNQPDFSRYANITIVRPQDIRV